MSPDNPIDHLWEELKPERKVCSRRVGGRGTFLHRVAGLRYLCEKAVEKVKITRYSDMLKGMRIPLTIRITHIPVVNNSPVHFFFCLAIPETTQLRHKSVM